MLITSIVKIYLLFIFLFNKSYTVVVKKITVKNHNAPAIGSVSLLIKNKTPLSLIRINMI